VEISLHKRLQLLFRGLDQDPPDAPLLRITLDL